MIAYTLLLAGLWLWYLSLRSQLLLSLPLSSGWRYTALVLLLASLVLVVTVEAPQNSLAVALFSWLALAMVLLMLLPVLGLWLRFWRGRQ